MSSAAAGAAALAHYDDVAQAAAERVIAAYSTSFGMATRLLPPRCRPAIRAVYALVRVADEIVDGVGAAAGLSPAEQLASLRDLENETLRAMASGFSTNLVVHAFARTARATNITPDLLRPFMASMAMDLEPRDLDEAEQEVYVYGSAEVVGLMCLRVFLAGQGASAADTATMEAGARSLGAAFQNVNFLRDLAADTDLGRGYLPAPGTEQAHDGERVPGRPAPLDEATKRAWLKRVDDDLRAAEAGLALLPRDCRPGVRAAHALFAELNRRIAATPLEVLAHTRVRVPGPVKARLLARALASEAPWRG